MRRLEALALLLGIAALCTGQTLSEGVAALEAGRLDDATRILTDVTTREPKSFEPNFYLGMAHFRAGRSSQARKYFELATTLGPDKPQAWKLLGIVTTTTGDLDSAVTALRRACNLDPRDEEACYYLARDLFALGHYEAARAPFDLALRAAPTAMHSKVHRAIALNSAASGDAANAESHFAEAIRLWSPKSPDSENPRIDYGAFLFRLGRTDDALKPLQQAVREAPDSARANLELGRVLLHTGQLDQAVAQLQKAVRLAPTDANAHLQLGRAYLKLGKTEEGEREMRLGRDAWEGKR